MTIETHQFYPVNFIHLFPQEKINEWLAKGKQELFKKGDLVCTPDKMKDYVYFIVEGHVRVFHIHLEGKECILGVLSKGEFIDLLNLFSDRESKLFAKALTDGKVVSISKSEIQSEIKNNALLSTALLHYFSNRLGETIEVLEQVAYGKVEERLLFLMRKLAKTSEKDSDWSPLPRYITHKDLAGMIASTRETVTFVINKLTQMGEVRQENNRIWIKLDEN